MFEQTILIEAQNIEEAKKKAVREAGGSKYFKVVKAIKVYRITVVNK